MNGRIVMAARQQSKVLHRSVVAAQNDAALLLAMLDKLEAGKPLSEHDITMRESIRRSLAGDA